MPITITIHGDDAGQVLRELKEFGAGLTGNVYSPNKGERPETVPTVIEETSSPTSAPDQPEEETVSPSEEEVEVGVDSDGIPFDPEMHTGTKLKDGRWRMKKGCERPEPDTEEVEETEDTDEFAAFTEAAKESEEVPEVPERTWTDADLGQLCNDAAMKLNNPAPIKEIIAQFVPEDQVAHSRNIPADKREEFAQAVEAKAGIEYAG